MSRFLWPITEGSVHFRLFSKRETLKEGPLKLEDIVMEDVSCTCEDVSLSDDVSLCDEDVSLSDEDVSLCDEDVSLSDEDVSLSDEDISLCDEDVSLSNEDVSLSDEDVSLSDEERGSLIILGSSAKQLRQTNNQAHEHRRERTVSKTTGRKPLLIPVTKLEDGQVIRTAEFHPSGRLYASGANSKSLRICAYPKLNEVSEKCETHKPTILIEKMKHHKGSIYCLAWNGTGDLLATGSNDKTIKLMRFNPRSCNIEGGAMELTMHMGTVRDLCFMEDLSNQSSLLISGGSIDNKIFITDCETGVAFQTLTGHSGTVLSLYTWGGATFVSGSRQDDSFWDLRSRGCVNVISAPRASGFGPGSSVSAVCVDPSGRLLVTGHEDSTCMLYDITGCKIIQCFQPHNAELRTIRFSPKARYLLTGSYDHKVILSDLQGDLSQPIPGIVVAEHKDKVIQARWHPTDFSILTTSADKNVILWGFPTN
ncbi:WD repeat-containing protein 47-like [Tachypleus tridentatus]|uniref:WD repeat-containing protein 47-like n=1 Tax=Tachypleus tridentatus TaxID=6853 RepID=UPI003FD15278